MRTCPCPPLALAACAFLLGACMSQEDLAQRKRFQFEMGLRAWEKAQARGERLTDTSTKNGGTTYFAAIPHHIGPLMNEHGRAVLEDLRANHATATGRDLAARCLAILDSPSKRSQQIAVPFRTSFIHYYYE